MDSTTHLLNNLGLVESPCKTALKSFFLAPHLCTRILIDTMTGLLKKSLLTCQSGWREIQNTFLVISWVCMGLTQSTRGYAKFLLEPWALLLTTPLLNPKRLWKERKWSPVIKKKNDIDVWYWFSFVIFPFSDSSVKNLFFWNALESTFHLNVQWDRHYNFSHICLLVKMASKTVTRSISYWLNESRMLKIHVQYLKSSASESLFHSIITRYWGAGSC